MAKDRKKRVRLVDVAERCQLHKSTVSLILNENLRNFPVRPETVERVKKTAREMGYVPNRFAQTLVTQQTHLIGYSFVYSLPSDPNRMDMRREGTRESVRSISPNLLGGILTASQKMGYDVVCIPRAFTGETALRARQSTMDLLDGVIWIHPSKNNDEYMELHEKNKNVVLIGQPTENAQIPVCDVDNYHEAFRMTKHLIDSGCKKIVFFCDVYPMYLVGTARYKGYCDALKAAGIEFSRKLICAGSMSFSDEFDKLQHLLDNREFDGLLLSASHAFGEISAVFDERQIDLYNDLHIGSFLDCSEYGFTRNDISVIEFDQYKMGYLGTTMLIEVLDGGNLDGEMRTIECKLRPRGQQNAG